MHNSRAGAPPHGKHPAVMAASDAMGSPLSQNPVHIDDLSIDAKVEAFTGDVINGSSRPSSSNDTTNETVERYWYQDALDELPENDSIRKIRAWHNRYPNEKDPLIVMEEFLVDKRLRLVDFFNTVDKDRSGGITPPELLNAFKNKGMQLSALQQEELLERLDGDSNGEIQYAELSAAHKQLCSQLRAVRAHRVPVVV